MGFPWAAAAGAASGIAGSFITNAGNKKRLKEANDHEIDLWRMNNKYNHPTAQMTRLREAGLNPNLIYGSSPTSATGNATPAKGHSPAEYKMESPVREITAMADFKQKEAQTDNLREQNSLIMQDTLLRAAQVNKTASEGQSAAVKASIDKELRDTSVEIMREELKQKEQGTIQSEIETKVKSQSAQARVMDIHYRALNARATLKGTQLQNALKNYEIELNKLGIQKDDSFIMRILGGKFGRDIYNRIEAVRKRNNLKN